MARRTTSTAARTKAPAVQHHTVDTDRVTVRGLDARDLAALGAYVAKRGREVADLGATVTQNSVVRALLRAALTSAGAYDLPGVPPPPAVP